MRQMDITIAGVGGQGSILAGIILGSAAVIYDKKYAVQTQAYASQLRGGFAATWVIVSDEPIEYPRVIRPDVLVAQAQDSINRYADDLKPGGLLIIDSDMISTPPPGIEKIISVPATSLSRQKIRAPVTANMIILGSLWKATNVVSRESLEKAITGSVPPGKENLNLEAFNLGIESVNSPLS